MTMSGLMQYDAVEDAWFGTVDLQGLSIVGVPEPDAIPLLVVWLIGVAVRGRGENSTRSATPDTLS